MLRNRPEPTALAPVSDAIAAHAVAGAGSRSCWCAGGLLAMSGWGMLVAPAATAQTTAPSRALMIQPTASISQTFTDNYLLSASEPAFDAITRLTAGLAVNANAGPVRGYFD